jgi:hypothetical protein
VQQCGKGLQTLAAFGSRNTSGRQSRLNWRCVPPLGANIAWFRWARSDLQGHAFNHAFECERPKPRALKGTSRDGRVEGADVENHWLDAGMIPSLALPKVKLAIRSRESVYGDLPNVIASFGIKRAKVRGRQIE